MIDFSALREGDEIVLTIPVIVKTIGFHNRHVWVRTKGWARHEFAIPADAEECSFYVVDLNEASE